MLLLGLLGGALAGAAAFWGLATTAPDSRPLPTSTGDVFIKGPGAASDAPALVAPELHGHQTVAGLLQIFLGGFGVGRFYLGNVGMAFAQLTLYLFSFVFLLLSFVVFPVAFPLFLFAVFWPLVDGIVLLAGHPRDRAGRPLRS